MTDAAEIDPLAASTERARQCASLVRSLLADIPMARAMQLRSGSCDGASLVFAAPLAPNINDKGCAFGGSLASLMTLAGWALIKLALDARGTQCDIYVQDSQVRYLAPVWQDFEARAHLAEGQDFASVFDPLDARGKARVDVQCHVPLPDGGVAATLAARFVAIARR